MKTPEYLKKGSKIALVAPARKIGRDEIAAAVKWIEDKGFVAVYDNRLFAEYHQLAGDDDFRAGVLQDYLDRDDIDAIFCVRGGYGTIRIVDKLDFTKFAKHPKWIVGYSDVTVLHAKMQQLGYQSIHGTIPINFPNNTPEALESLYEALTNPSFRLKRSGMEKSTANVWSRFLDKLEMTGEIVGGNLSVLYSMLGSDLFPETDGKILFIEDLDEYLYHIDRMMMGLKRAGKLANLKALLVGAFTDMHDNTVPFGMTAKEIIYEKVKEYGYPIIWDVSAGHIDNNLAIIFG
ncbi:MAG: LD-carboxypeptidase [Bacteroidales bacterium]|nr:LD-carboxypeptidase [Bacteroidales bacterium]